jgi:hypothetical protein
MIKKFSVIILLVALVTGCAPATFGELRKKPGGGEASFQATQNYASVYRTILTNARKCYQGGAITAQLIVQGDLYPDTKSGEITVALHGGLGVDTYLGIDIKAIDDGNTTVKNVFGIIQLVWQHENYTGMGRREVNCLQGIASPFTLHRKLV